MKRVRIDASAAVVSLLSRKKYHKSKCWFPVCLPCDSIIPPPPSFLHFSTYSLSLAYIIFFSQSHIQGSNFATGKILPWCKNVCKEPLQRGSCVAPLVNSASKAWITKEYYIFSNRIKKLCNNLSSAAFYNFSGDFII